MSSFGFQVIFDDTKSTFTGVVINCSSSFINASVHFPLNDSSAIPKQTDRKKYRKSNSIKEILDNPYKNK